MPYPVQVLGTEVLLEFIGESDGTAAPRLAETRPRGSELAGLWDQLVQALVTLAGHGLAHGDMSAYNLLVHHGRLIMIDLPQVVDVIAQSRAARSSWTGTPPTWPDGSPRRALTAPPPPPGTCPPCCATKHASGSAAFVTRQTFLTPH